MALKTTLEKLTEIEDAISKAQRALKLGRGGFNRESASLETMYAERDRLRNQYNTEQGNTAGRTYAANVRRF